jgi:hypothetical protein
MRNKLLIIVCVLLLPVSVIGAFSLGKNKIPQPKPSAYDTLVDQPTQVAPDPLNPQSKAEVIIDAPIEAKVGQMVRFDVSKSSGSMYKWKVIPSTTNFETYENGRKACFSSETPGEYTFVVACALNGSVDVKTHTLKITGDTPVPPIPTPTPPPSPTSTLNAKIKSWMTEVNSPTKKVEALKLSAGFSDIATKIDAGTLTTPEDIIAKLADSDRTILGTQLSAWVPFLTNLQNEMKNRSAAGVLTTPAQHSDLLKEIAQGLKEVGS